MMGLGVRTSGGTLEILDLPDPREPRAGELLLDVVAAGIGPWDALLHTGGWDVGLVPPAALGVEGVGRVSATGPDETGFRSGDLVLVHEAPLPGGSGTWAEKVHAHADRLRALGADEVIDTHLDGWAQQIDRRFDAVLIAATATSENAMWLLIDGGCLTSITSDAPQSVRGITTNDDFYVQPDGRALSQLAILAAVGELSINVQVTPVKNGIAIANEVAAGRSGGVKHVLEF